MSFGQANELAKQAGYLKADCPEEYSFGEKYADTYFNAMLAAQAKGTLETEFYIKQLPKGNDVTLFVTQKANPGAMTILFQKYPGAENDGKKIQAFGIAFGMRLIDLLNAQ